MVSVLVEILFVCGLVSSSANSTQTTLRGRQSHSSKTVDGRRVMTKVERVETPRISEVESRMQKMSGQKGSGIPQAMSSLQGLRRTIANADIPPYR